MASNFTGFAWIRRREEGLHVQACASHQTGDGGANPPSPQLLWEVPCKKGIYLSETAAPREVLLGRSQVSAHHQSHCMVLKRVSAQACSKPFSLASG